MWGESGYEQLPDPQCSMSPSQLALPRSNCSKSQVPKAWAPATNMLCNPGKVKSPFWASDRPLTWVYRRGVNEIMAYELVSAEGSWSHQTEKTLF